MEDRVKRIEKALDHFLPERKGSLSETVTDAISMMSSMLSPVTVFSKSSVKACSLDSLLFVILGSFPLSQ